MDDLRCPLLLGPIQVVVAQWQRADTLAGDLENGITHRWRHRWYARLTDAAPLLTTAERQMCFHLGHGVEPEHLVIIEIALDDAAVFDGDLAIQGGSEAIDDAALHLLGDGQRIHHVAAVDRTHDTFDPDFAAFTHRHFCDFGNDGTEAFGNRHALRRSRGHGFAPIGLCAAVFSTCNQSG